MADKDMEDIKAGRGISEKIPELEEFVDKNKKFGKKKKGKKTDSLKGTNIVHGRRKPGIGTMLGCKRKLKKNKNRVMVKVKK